MILPLLEALLPLLLLFATDFLGRGIERHANGRHPEPTLAVGWDAGALAFIVGKSVLLRRCVCLESN
jgi:hypothetical protein